MNRFFVLSLFLFACAPVLAQDGPAEDVLDTLTQQPDEFSLVAYAVDEPESGVYHNADVQRPLASTVKILVLAAYAQQVDGGALDPDERVPIEAINAYYLEGTDGGAHPAAIQALRAMEKVADETIALDDVAWAMIRFSDNAATDFLLMRMGRDVIDAIPGRLSLSNSRAPLPISGFFLASVLPAEVGTDAAIGSDALADRAWLYAERLRDDATFRGQAVESMMAALTSLGYDGQMAAMVSFPGGSARDYASIMARLHRGTLLSASTSVRMLDHLDWPMDFPGNQQVFDQFATKGGALPGILTSADLADAKPTPDGVDAPPTVVVLLTESLPAATWGAWMQSFQHQQFEVRLLQDPAFLQAVRARLSE